MQHPGDKIIMFENFTDPFLAEVIRGKFEAHGIPCFLKGIEYAYGVPMMDGIQLMIFARDLETARTVREEDSQQ